MEDRRLQFLSQLPLFSAVNAEYVAEILPLLKQRTYRRGEVVYHESDVPNAVFIIVRGAVKTHLASPTGKQFTVGLLCAGEIFGHNSVFADNRDANAVAVEETELLRLDRDQMYSFLHRHPAAMDELIRLMATSRRRLLERLYDQTMLDVPTRVAKVLCRLEPLHELDLEGRIALPDYVTQAEIAALVSATRESVNQCLRLFARQGWIEIARGRILILEPAKLSERAQATSEWAPFADLPSV